jgi:pantoate--beta-alanine ligase
MRIVKTAPAMSAWSEALRREGVTIGLVPTMGALHAGHQALIRAARLTCDAVVVSVFVNPLQFGRDEDLSRYPRTLRSDTLLCRREGADALFVPSSRDIYPPGFETSISLRQVARRWEGERRPGHFEGVATVVAKLLSLIGPDRAFFGQKDYQQALVVRRLVDDLNIGTRIVVRPTVREKDGLALSSRNAYLKPRERRAARVLYWALVTGRAAMRRGERSAAAVRGIMGRIVRMEPLAKMEYLAVCDPLTLEPLTRIGKQAVLLGAIRIGRTRLIDNLLVSLSRR